MGIAESLYNATGWLDMYQQSIILAALSGGKDSIVATDVYVRWCRANGRTPRIMSIDTGLAADNWRNEVTQLCMSQWGVTPEFWSGAGIAWYEKNVIEYGFGYTPGHHVTYYRMLKQDAIRKCLRANKRKRSDRVVFVTGVRRDESTRRAQTPYHMRNGSRVTLNGICEFKERDVFAYMQRLLPSVSIKARSSDCHCNWACADTVETLRSHSPALAEKIERIECKALARGLWRYGERPNRAVVSARHEDMPEDSLCVNCANHG